ncbi:hypothetical protein D3C73_690230 [compost metagenome]
MIGAIPLMAVTAQSTDELIHKEEYGALRAAKLESDEQKRDLPSDYCLARFQINLIA